MISVPLLVVKPFDSLATSSTIRPQQFKAALEVIVFCLCVSVATTETATREVRGVPLFHQPMLSLSSALNPTFNNVKPGWTHMSFTSDS